jgi:hypothetical protein
MSQSGGINSEFSELTDEEFFRTAASILTARADLEALLRKSDRDINAVGREFGNRLKMWGMNPTILRRELRLRGYGV